MDYKKILDMMLDENDFTVGGGCASALAGAMACGLMGMVANLSKGKNYGYEDEKYDAIIKELNDMKGKFLEGSVNDNKAYLLIVNAYKLPKLTDEEKQERRKAIQNAGVEAANVPLSNALLNKRTYDIGRDLLEKSNPAAITDLQAGIDLAKVGIDAGRANVLANISLIKDEKVVEDLKKQLKNLD
ncbi:formimidoyltetrahydrofolate cyclodeaminase [Peptoniphilus sp. AGMB00490]|uniref:Formimidoyltetrahydrofolate cyclodeaminase n=1 Tax=Peptoniphilus faecalis TaxID=2731255 RepID=A0A848RJS4_9FIRM|nr:cyclodeaminase/cyclohydrolase family protein [Peptoniphilus faecalis]NMW85669.1 formimidoyltetrahydrofolate cyclodeaminase [Peptoniphilus faecalis]